MTNPYYALTRQEYENGRLINSECEHYFCSKKEAVDILLVIADNMPPDIFVHRKSDLDVQFVMKEKGFRTVELVVLKLADDDPVLAPKTQANSK